MVHPFFSFYLSVRDIEHILSVIPASHLVLAENKPKTKKIVYPLYFAVFCNNYKIIPVPVIQRVHILFLRVHNPFWVFMVWKTRLMLHLYKTIILYELYFIIVSYVIQ